MSRLQTRPLLILLTCLTFFISPLLATPPSTKQLLAAADEAPVPPAFEYPLPPSLDPWYRAPTTFAWRDTPPGTVLKIRRAALLNYTVGNAMAAYQILYRSTDSQYNAVWDVTTLFIPWWQYRCSVSMAHLCAHAILSYQLPYNTANVDASPSYALYVGEPYGEIQDALGLGWFVSVPDYEGPLASYAAGLQSGYATIDSVRAVLQVAGYFGLRLDKAKVALWGFSGGALASEWAAELAGQYAPKLQISGVALGGLTPNLTSVITFLNKSPRAGLISAGMLGIATQHPDAYAWIMARLRPATASRFLGVRYLDAAGAVAVYKNENIYDYFVGGYDDVHLARVMTDMYNTDGYMGYHGVPRMPVFIYKSVLDELSPVEDTDELVERFCGVGANILYHRNLVGTHNEELVNGRQRAFTWLSSVLDGSYSAVYSAMGCTVMNVTYNIAPYFPWLNVPDGSE